MSTVHFIVCRSRSGWAVNADADRLSEHATLNEARIEAMMLAADAQERGCEADVIDLASANEDSPPSES